MISKSNDLSGTPIRYTKNQIAEQFKELKTILQLELNDDVYNYINHYTTGQRDNFEIALSLEDYYHPILSKIF